MPQNPQKMSFIIVSMQRSGTHLLSSSIRSHPELSCQGEIGYSREAASAAIKHSIPGVQSAHINTNGRFIFDFHPDFINNYLDWLPSGSGFVAQYNQLDRKWGNNNLANGDAPMSDVDFSDVRVIHLIRTNIFEAAISEHINKARLRGEKKQVFRSNTEIDFSQTFTLNRDFLVHHIQQRRHHIDYWCQKLAKDGANVLPLEYESLYDEASLTGKWMKDEYTVLMPRSAAKKVCGFLNVKYHDLRSGLKRVNRPNYEDYIVNWDEIKDLETRIKT